MPWSPQGPRWGLSPDFGGRLPANGAQNWQVHSGTQALSRTGAAGWRARQVVQGLDLRVHFPKAQCCCHGSGGFRFISKDCGSGDSSSRVCNWQTLLPSLYRPASRYPSRASLAASISSPLSPTILRPLDRRGAGRVLSPWTPWTNPKLNACLKPARPPDDRKTCETP